MFPPPPHASPLWSRRRSPETLPRPHFPVWKEAASAAGPREPPLAGARPGPPPPHGRPAPPHLPPAAPTAATAPSARPGPYRLLTASPPAAGGAATSSQAGAVREEGPWRRRGGPERHRLPSALGGSGERGGRPLARRTRESGGYRACSVPGAAKGVMGGVVRASLCHVPSGWATWRGFWYRPSSSSQSSLSPVMVPLTPFSPGCPVSFLNPFASPSHQHHSLTATHLLPKSPSASTSPSCSPSTAFPH